MLFLLNACNLRHYNSNKSFSPPKVSIHRQSGKQMIILSWSIIRIHAWLHAMHSSLTFCLKLLAIALSVVDARPFLTHGGAQTDLTRLLSQRATASSTSTTLPRRACLPPFALASLELRSVTMHLRLQGLRLLIRTSGLYVHMAAHRHVHTFCAQIDLQLLLNI